jgi:predicted nucleotidyltransferase
MTKQAPDDIAAAIGAASALLASRYPSADCAFVAGSIMRGEGTLLSDIDLVVIFGHVETGWRESLRFEGDRRVAPATARRISTSKEIDAYG